MFHPKPLVRPRERNLAHTKKALPIELDNRAKPRKKLYPILGGAAVGAN